MIDLFAGTGGFSTALKNLKCVFANDFDSNSEKIYKANHPETNFINKNINDINISDIPKHDILCGGFPCQPFSIAGNRKGFEDERSNVFWKILDIIEYHKPKIILLENVKNLKTHENGDTYKIIEDNIKKNGYNVKSIILDTSKITELPHHRERIYIIAFKDTLNIDKLNLSFDRVENKKITFYLEKDVDNKFYYTDKLKVYDEIKKEVVKHISNNTIYQYRRKYVRENKSNCCPTLTANMGGGGHNVPLILDDKGIRKLTPRECFNLQGFPDDYILPSKISNSGLYKLAGNAISVPVIEKLIGRIIECL